MYDSPVWLKALKEGEVFVAPSEPAADKIFGYFSSEK